MHTTRVNDEVPPTDSSDCPIYEVRFWKRDYDNDSVEPVYIIERYLLEEFTHVIPVLMWAQENAHGRKFTVYVKHFLGYEYLQQDYLIYGEHPFRPYQEIYR